MTKTVLVTGASAGIGKATAILLAQQGYNVYGAARRLEKMEELKDYGIQPIALDVTKEESIVYSADFQRGRKDRCFGKQCWIWAGRSHRRYINGRCTLSTGSKRVWSDAFGPTGTAKNAGK